MPTAPQILIGDAYLPLVDGTIRDKFVGFEGPRGTAKTRSILTAILCRALQTPGSRWLLARSTRTRLSQSVLKTLEDQVFPAFGMPVPGGAGTENRSVYKLPNGSELIAMGLDDQSRTQSVEVAGVYVSEAVEIEKLDDVLALAGAMRQDVPVPVRQCVIDMNPGPPRHWINEAMETIPAAWRQVNTLADYQRLLDHARKPAPPGKWKRVVTRHQDNPGYFDVANWRYTPLGEDYLATLSHLKGHLRRRWLDGDWVAAEGGVFPEFDEARHVVEDFEPPTDWPVYVGWDPGFDHPTAILWFAVAPNDTWYIFDEIYQGGLGVTDHCVNVKRKSAGRNVREYYADPQHAFRHTADSTRSIAEQAAESGIHMLPWPRSTDVEAMVNGVRERLLGWGDGESTGVIITIDRRPRLKVCRRCVNTIGEFQSWRYKRMANGELPAGDDQFEDRLNHCMDVVKGMVAMPLGSPGRVEVYG